MTGAALSRLRPRLDELPGQGVLTFAGRTVVKTSWPEIGRMADALRDELRSRGLGPRMRVGVIGDNRMEWVALELALLDLRCVPVVFPPEELRETPLDELGERFGLAMLLVTEAERKLRDQPADWVGILRPEPSLPHGIRRAATMDGRPGTMPEPLDDDVLTLVFSSGTSGRPKCLMISREGTEDQLQCFGRDYAFQPDDRILLALPLSIYQQRLMLYAAVIHGFDVALVETTRIFHALKEMKPTIIAGPPILYEPLENRFHALPRPQRLALTMAAHALRRVRPRSLQRRLQRRVFAAFHEAFGGQARFMLTGAAPARMSTLELYDLLGLPLFQAYGLTETGFVSWNLPGKNRLGSTGRLVHEGSVEIAGDGEIIVGFVRPQCRGYLHCDEDEVRRVFLSNGRIATGDIGRIDEQGYLHIVGRKKQIIVTQGGYKVQPEVIEQAIETLREAQRVVVFGGGELASLVALVSMASEDAERRQRIEQHVASVNEKLPAPSRIGRVVFTSTPINRENGLLNRNLKVDRDAVYRHFREQILHVS